MLFDEIPSYTPEDRLASKKLQHMRKSRPQQDPTVDYYSLGHKASRKQNRKLNDNKKTCSKNIGLISLILNAVIRI